MLRAYNRLHEAVKRLLILAHIFWWAYYTNLLLKSYLLDWWKVLLGYLGPPFAVLIIITIIFYIIDHKN